MNEEAKWAKIKDLYLRIGDLAPELREQHLREIEGLEPDVATAVRELIDVKTADAPDIGQSVWNAQMERAYSFAIGQTLLDRFEICEFLGAGGTGEVYKAYDRVQRINVAVKTLQHGILGSRAAASMLRNEINTARQIAHHNVCKLYDVHVDLAEGQSVPFFTMEWIDGRTLAEELRIQGPLPLPVVRTYTEQLLAGLEAAHQSGVVHRDLKSVNLMLTGNPVRLVIMDFGLARRLDPATMRQKTETTEAFSSGGGTPAYMARELLTGGKATPASDLHAVGVILFEMLSCRRPFEGATPTEISSKRLTQDAPSLLEYQPNADRTWAYAIEKCLEAEPAKRPQSVADLRGILHNGPPMLWNRRKVVLSSVAALLAAGGASAYCVNHLRRGPATVAIADLEGQSKDTAFDNECRRALVEVSSLLAKQGIARAFLTGKTARQMPDGGGARFLLASAVAQGRNKPELHVQLRDLTFAMSRWSGSIAAGTTVSIGQMLAGQLAQQLSGWLNASWAWQDTMGGGNASPGRGLALDHFIRAKTLMEDSSSRNIAEAERYLKLSVQEDPQFALAWSALADAHLAQAGYTTGDSLSRLAQATEACNRALRLDPSLAEAHCSLAAIYQHNWKWEQAQEHYAEAMRLKTHFPRAHRWYAGFALQFGRTQETLDHMRLALQQDPHEKAAIVGSVLYLLYCGRPQEAIALGEPVMDGRNLEGARFNVGQAYLRMAQLSSGDDARRWYQKALEQAAILESLEQKGAVGVKAPLSTRMFASVYAARRETHLLTPYLEKIAEGERNKAYSPADLALPNALIGNLETAVLLLERARTTNPTSLLYIKVNPFLDSLRSLPRFVQLIADMRL
ncbi:hypothetical protein F183_A11660 [Bryobacterales bacterium F-183]|nr:hypothetical protein F183_A11660 [Bryobacterales bacterium F-183]